MEYKLRKQDEKNYIWSDEQSHEPIISKEIFDMAQQKRKNRACRGNRQIGQTPKHLLSGLLKCPECGSGMVISYNRWVNKKKNPDMVTETRTYICGHYNRSGTYGECHRNGISSERIEKEVVEYTKRLVHNEKFVDYVKMKIGQSVDVSEIEKELASYDKKLKALERNKKNLERDIDSLLDDDKFANRKRNDMNKRLDKIYEEMDSVESERIDCLNRLEAVQEQQLNEKKIYQMLLEFDRIYDRLSLEEQRNVLHALISEIQLYKKDEIKESKTYIKKIKFAFDIDNIGENLDNKGNNVETVVMLSHKKPDSVINVKVEFGEGEGKVPLDNIAKRAEAYKPKERVTYKMIKEYIEAKYGFKVHTAYIAEVKRELGLPMYDAPNAVEELKQPRKHPTAEKAEAIKEALKHFEVI